MKTIYIKGIDQYKKNVRKGLGKSDLVEGVDFIEGVSGNDYMLMWINNKMDLRTLKLAIGAKYVWKNRLKFYTSIEEMNPPRNNDELTAGDLQLLKRIKEGLVF